MHAAPMPACFNRFQRCPASSASELLAVMEDEAATALQPKSEPFWICVAALRTFYEEHGVLPLQVGKRGDVPARRV